MARPRRPLPTADLEQLRVSRMLTDGVTGLPLLPVGFAGADRVPHLGVIYLQIGRFAGIESLYGWQLYDRVLRLVAESLRADLAASPLEPHVTTLQFNGSDGFYLVFSLPGAPRNGSPAAKLESEAARLRDGIMRRLRQGLDRAMVDLMSVHASALYVPDDPRTRPSRNLLRALRDAARMVESQEKAERLGLISGCRAILASRKLRTVYQPVFDIQERTVVGFEALIRGPAGELEQPDVLFAAARESDLALELESLCLETIFRRLPRATQQRKLFVNASPRLLTHPVFLDDRNLEEIRRAHPQVVIEVSEKEVVGDYHAFRGVLDRLRGNGLQIAIDDAGSGYSGLEAILQLRPQYIKVANTIVQNLHEETIKRGVITALASVGREIDASLIAEGIEQPEELKALVDLGVNYGQGFLLGRPSGRIARAGH
jgi:EAL domain-containing protein (putative c-di-GMP-specific phosphodiesterase class I)/GGDEF domain-containing protein